MATNFEKAFRAELSKLKAFTDRVEEDVRAFNKPTLGIFVNSFQAIGLQALDELFDHLDQRHFKKGSVPDLLQALRPRFMNRWKQIIGGAFSVALDSVSEADSPFRAKNVRGQLRSIVARLNEATGKGGEEPALPTRVVTVREGVSRATLRKAQQSGGDFLRLSRRFVNRTDARTIYVGSSIAGIIGLSDTDDDRMGAFVTVVFPEFRGLGLAAVAKNVFAKDSEKTVYLVAIDAANRSSLVAARKAGFVVKNGEIFAFRPRQYAEFIKITERNIQKLIDQGPLAFVPKNAPGGLEVGGYVGLAATREQLQRAGSSIPGGRPVYGFLRGNRTTGRQTRMRLVPYLSTLITSFPKNVEREYVALLARYDNPANTPTLYKISGGLQHNSCKTCKALNGRVLTEAAARFAASSLRPVLFHPNCRHSLETGGLRGTPLREYDASRHGPLVTVEVLRDMAKAGIVELQSPRTPSVAL